MSLLPRSLSLRLALAFALVAVVLLGAIGLYLYRSLEREIVWRDDQALLGRLERMQALLDDSASVDALRQRPQLYENMLGNRDSLLWLLDAQGRALIEINPTRLAIPPLSTADPVALQDIGEARLAWRQLPGEAGLTLVAGRLLSEREQMLGAYRTKLWWALSVGALLASVLGWLISRRALRPVRRLTRQALAIDVQHLHLRLDDSTVPSELEPLRAALNQMLARLEQGFARLSRFSEDLAHEMRTPLGNLMGQTQQLLHRARSVEDYQALLVSNQEEYERLARMIDNMLLALCTAGTGRATVRLLRRRRRRARHPAARRDRGRAVRRPRTDPPGAGQSRRQRAALRRGRQPCANRQRYRGRLAARQRDQPGPAHRPGASATPVRPLLPLRPFARRAGRLRRTGAGHRTFDRAAAWRRGGGVQRRQRDPLHPVLAG